MVARRSCLSFSFLFSGVYASSPLCRGGLYAQYASQIAGYQPAQQFCSQNYPVPIATTTVVGAASTVFKTVATATATDFVATTVQTLFYSTTTVTDTVATVTDTSTVSTAVQTIYATSDSLSVQTNTVTATATTSEVVIVEPRKKRNASPTTLKTTLKTSAVNAAATPAAHAGNLLDQIWQEVVQLGEEIIGNVCDCIETQATTTVISSVVSTSTVTVTGTTTVSATATIFSTATVVSIIPTTTATTTTTFVTTITSTTTAPLPGPTCVPGSNPGDSFTVNCSNGSSCETTAYTCWVSSDLSTCYHQCQVDDPNYIVADFDTHNNCYCIHSCCPS